MTRRYVLSLHGIRTRGSFQKDLNETLEEAGFRHVPLDYGYFHALQLLLPWSRRKKIDWFRDQYQQHRERHGDQPPSIIAHSFGTYLVCSALSKYDLTFDDIILCGSIVPESFSWSSLIDAKRVARVFNDYGYQDVWARLVGWLVEDAGGSGVRGFTDPAVIQRRNAHFGHSDYFYRLHYKNTWIPFLQGLVPGEAPLLRNIVNWRFQLVRAAAIACLCVVVGLGIFRKRIPPPPPPAYQLEPCLVRLLGLPVGPYRYVLWMYELEVLGGTPDMKSILKAMVWTDLNTTLTDIGGIRTYAPDLERHAKKSCHQELPPLENLGVTTTLSGVLVLGPKEMVLNVYPLSTVGSNPLKVPEARTPLATTEDVQNREMLVNRATVNLLHALEIPLTLAQEDSILKQRRDTGSTETTGDALKSMGVDDAAGAISRSSGPDRMLSRWVFPAEACAGETNEDEALLTLLNEYCAALAARDLATVKRLQVLSAEQEQAMSRYFAAAQDLKVECKNVQVFQATDRALVTFTRRDEYVDARTQRLSHLEIRLSGECERQADGWRFLTFKRPT